MEPEAYMATPAYAVDLKIKEIEKKRDLARYRRQLFEAQEKFHVSEIKMCRAEIEFLKLELVRERFEKEGGE